MTFATDTLFLTPDRANHNSYVPACRPGSYILQQVDDPTIMWRFSSAAVEVT